MAHSLAMLRLYHISVWDGSSWSIWVPLTVCDESDELEKSACDVLVTLVVYAILNRMIDCCTL